MIEGVIIKKLKKNKDARGWLAEIFRFDEDNFKPVMSYVSETKPGVVRGPHEHVRQIDRFIFVGPGSFELYLWDRRKNLKTKEIYLKIKAGEKNPLLIIIPPGIVHGYKCISKIAGRSINLPSRLYRGKDKKEEVDEIRWEGIKDSPYIIK